MENYFIALEKIKCEVEKKNWLNYISWSDAWTEVKKIHPTATYTKIKNWDTYLFRSGTGWSVECEVIINWVSHTSDLAITDMRNQEIKYEAIKSTDIQNTLQRAFAKAIAMHWIWLYVYRGEDLPDDGNEASEVETKETKKEVKKDWAVHTCTKCSKDSVAEIFKWTYWECFKCEHCKGYSKPNLKKDLSDILWW